MLITQDHNSFKGITHYALNTSNYFLNHQLKENRIAIMLQIKLIFFKIIKIYINRISIFICKQVNHIAKKDESLIILHPDVVKF